ncbi:MAG: T9SS type A sorting domain-containing protein [Bacteroidales bacterium]|nr:T9SS type A sorting domain-containing protein [Bacteroidales bacterium]
MRKIYLILLIFQFSALSNGQNTFHKYIQQNDVLGLLYRCQKTSDEGFISVGNISDINSFASDFLIIKSDSDGNASWGKTASLTDNEQFTDVVETFEGEFVTVGSVFSTITFTSQVVVAKYNNSGQKLWSKIFSRPGSSVSANRIQKDNSGNVYVLGIAEVEGASSDYLIMQLDPNGNITQQKTIGTSLSDYPLSFFRNNQGDFFIGGWANSGTGENVHIVKVNSTFDVQWDTYIGGNELYFNYDMKETSSGNIVIAGRYYDQVNSYDVFLSELNKDTGEVLWAKSYTSMNGLPCYAYGLTIESGNIGITGKVEDGAIANTLLFQTDEEGNITWAEKISSTNETNAYGYGICNDSDGGYVVCGPREDGVNSAAQLIKISASGEVACNKTDFALSVLDLTPQVQHLPLNVNNGTVNGQDIALSELPLSGLNDACEPTFVNDFSGNNQFRVFPNPSNGTFLIESLGNLKGHVEVKVYSSQGKSVFSRSFDEILGSQVDIKGIEPGIYIIRLTGSDGAYFSKLIIN